MAAVTICSDLEPKKIKSVTVSIVSPSICYEVMELDAMILVFRMLAETIEKIEIFLSSTHRIREN